ncbi:SusD/RagB family nutrient-binding outer membrane lipoprotein [Flavobacterium flavipallidum]|uniref:SusD/RagB family nutrient-binding outer membrane lipoprotein n=1 Tax=Flavobacterium flavipallidum TaxID=3139140 RepID=A0ABU9HJ87_9FLAO
MFLSCENYLDVDTDKDYPTVAPLNFLLTNTQVSISAIGGYNDNMGRILSTYTHQFTSREDEDQYGVKVDDIPLENDWNATYLALTDLETLISQGTKSEDLIYVGIAQLEKAYIMANAVDLWGDVPYSEATKLTSGIISPKFDDQKEIYASIFQLIETAKTNIKTGKGLKPSTDDLIYGGKTEKWIRFANTFKLKLYNQTRLTSDFDTAGFNALIAENNFFQSIEDDFQFNHFDAISPSYQRNSLFKESYESTQFGTYQSPWFYEILKGVNPNIHNGNPDPRMNYYFYNQLQPGEFPADQGDATTGDPNADYWDASTGFFSIRFGSTGPDRDKSAENSYTYPGIFPAGGRYNDGEGGSVAVLDEEFSGRGIAPHRILTYDEYLYIKAELIQTGILTTGNVTDVLESALRASFAKVDQVVANSKTTQTVPELTGSTQVETFISKIITEFTNANTAKKLEIIMTQKWVGTFGDPADQYTDYRRTGYPILANPKSTSPEYQLNNDDGFDLDDSQTVLNNNFQVSFYWPQNELSNNANSPNQKNPSTYKIFWAN